MVTRKFWSDAEDARLTTLVAEGERAAAIAKTLERTPGGVIARARLLGLRVAGAELKQRKPREPGNSSPLAVCFKRITPR